MATDNWDKYTDEWLRNTSLFEIKEHVGIIKDHLESGGYIHAHTRHDLRILLYYIDKLENPESADFKEVLNTGA